MSRKSTSRKSSRSPVPPLEKSYLDEERLGLSNIVDINPWKDVNKYDKQEVGQIQEILVQFNNMVVEDKKNKRRSVGKSRLPKLSTKIGNENEDLQKTSTIKKTMKNDENQRSKNESNLSIVLQDNDETTDKTSGIRNTNLKQAEEPEELLEGKKAKFSKSQNHVELVVTLDDKDNKQKSMEKRGTSTSLSKATNNADLEGETTKNKIITDDKPKSCISESSIEIWKNVSIENMSDNQNIEEKLMEEAEDYQPQKEREKSPNSTVDLGSLNDKKNKRKSVAKNRTLFSSSRATDDSYLEVETTECGIIRNRKKNNYRNEENVAEQPVEQVEYHLEEKNEKSFESKNHGELNVSLDDKKNKRKSVEKRQASTSPSKATNNANLQKETTKKKMVKNDKKKSFINEEGKPLEEDEDDEPEEKKEKSSKSTYMHNDKKNKRKSVEKRRKSSFSSKATGSYVDLEEKSKKKEKMSYDAIRQWISESSVNDAIINVPESVATEISSNNQNTVDEVRKTMREENKDLSSKVINCREPSSVGKRVISSSAMKTIASNNAAEEQSILDKEKIQYLLITSDGTGSIVDPEENINSAYKRDNKSIESYEKKITTQKREKLRDETISETVPEKIVDVWEILGVTPPEIIDPVSPASKNDEVSYDETIGIQNYEPSGRDDFSTSSIISEHLSYQNFQVFSYTKELEKLASECENRENSVLQKNDDLAKQSSTMKLRSVSAGPEKKTFAEYSDNKSESNNTLNRESEENYTLKKDTELLVKQLSTSKAHSASAEATYKKFVEYNNNGPEPEHERKRMVKMAKAFEKFGKKFVKYSNIEQHLNYDGSNITVVTVDPDSDSYDSDSSSTSSSSSGSSSSSTSSGSSSSSSNSSSDSDESSSSESTSSGSSTCSCCSGCSSDSSYTSSSCCSSCSCKDCCEDTVYSEYTLASSPSTHPGSDDSSDSTIY